MNARASFHHHCVLAAATQKMRKYCFYRGAAARFFRDLLCCCHVSAVVNLINTECGPGDKLHPAERVFGYRGPLARLLVRLAAVEWTQAGRSFLSLMSLPNESSDISEGWVVTH